MAAGLGFKTFTTGEVLTAADTNGYLMQGVLVFASSAARAAAITSPQEGQYSFLKDTNSTEYYDGAAWVSASGSSGSSNVAGKNGVLNSNFSVAQRGTSISLAASAGTTYTLDRWCTQTGANQACTVSQELTADTTNLPFIQYALRYKRNTSQTGTGALTLLNAFETVNSRPFAGKAITLSFYARAGANYSAASSALAVKLDSGTGTDQNPFAGYTGAATVASTTATLTTTWQRFTATGTVGTTATELNVQVVFTPTGTAGANDYYEITGVQVEIASSASAYSPATSTQALELAACQRYLPAIYGGSYSGYAYAANAILYAIPFSVTARVAPTGITVTGTWTGYSLNSGSNFTPVFNMADKSGGNVDSGGGRTITAGQGSRLESTAGTILFTGCEL